MKLFVDDERKPPDNSWVVMHFAHTAIEYLRNPPLGPVEVLSLDHDLGDVPVIEGVQNGYDVAAWLEEQVYIGQMIPPKVLRVHSANPVGRARIMQTFQSIARYCEQHEMEIPKIEG